MEEREARELLAFLRPEARGELRGGAVELVLGLTGSAEGRRLLLARPAFVEALLALSGDPSAALAEAAFHALVNLAAEPGAAGALRAGLPGLLRRLLQPAFPLAAPACALLANWSREEGPCRELLAELRRGEAGLAPLLEAFCAHDPRPGAPWHHLGSLLANLSRLPEARDALLRRSGGALQRLLPFLHDAGSALRRRGVAGTLRNCCFDYRHHEWLLSEQVDLLPFLLLPLAGPEEFPEDEMEKLPLDLQYLPAEKQREPEADIRKMLLETLLLLTATKPGRLLVREKGTYFVLRELHKWEGDHGVRAACEKLIQVLIGDEPEAGMENLLEVKIPTEVEQQLQHLDQEEEEEEEVVLLERIA
ncbi:protein HGH1 homolog [Pantherophis guttatus]|uniref:Protein HGH1 homolog n=1 Tax=Pantherophis guttatus TaxID=94885 RepID=A0A6P9C7S9_PANGU|nr:protein HGH1 homolog [Pantherophis guttatus]